MSVRVRALALFVVLSLGAGACIAPSVVAVEDRGVDLGVADLSWRPGAQAEVPGYYVSELVDGPMAAVLRGLVYLFGEDGSYSGAALLDGVPPHFEVVGGEWELSELGLVLDGGPPATFEVAGDGSIRLSGEEGSVVLRRQVER